MSYPRHIRIGGFSREIEEIEKDSTEIGSQRERERRMQQARIAPRSTARSTGGQGRAVGRQSGRPVCTTCTGVSQSTARSIVAKDRSIARSTDCMMVALCSCWSTEHMGRSTSRSTDRRVLAVRSRFRFFFCLESNPIGVS